MDGDRRPSRTRWWVLGGVVAVVAVAVTVVVTRAGGSASGGATAPPHFVDDTSASGLQHAYTGDGDFLVGGGLATFDCNDDGFPDLYVAGGSSPAALYRNTSAVGGALRFEQVTSPVTDLTSVTGAYPLDVDSDGIADLVVLRRAEGNVLLHGLGDCRFEQANQHYGLDSGTAWTVAFSATWEGSNALPTLAFGNYLVPGTYDCDSSALVRPASADGYAAPIPLSPGYCTLSMLFSDWSRTGRRDLRLANDRHYYRTGSDELWRIEPGQPPYLYTEADGWTPLQIWGMGIASQDLDGDGYPEVFLTSQGDNKLQTLDDHSGRPSYHDIALQRKATVQRPFTGGDVLPSTAWHPQFDDVNNDGLLDLFVTKGNVGDEVDMANRDPNNLLIGQTDGTFREGAEAAGIVNFDKSRGASVADLNLDGLPDLVVVHRETDVTLWRNVGKGDAQQAQPMGHWVQLRLQQPAPNVDAIGAWVDVKFGDRTFTKEITVGGGHASGQLGWLHVGLGSATTAEVRVTWPDGETGPWMTVTADTFATVERGASQPTRWQPRA